jgi:hypothetical protein
VLHRILLKSLLFGHLRRLRNGRRSPVACKKRDRASGAGGNSDAENCASTEMRWGVLVSTDSSNARTDGRPQFRDTCRVASGSQARNLSNRRERGRILRSLLRTARMLVSARHRRRNERCKQYRISIRMGSVAAGMMVSAGTGRLRLGFWGRERSRGRQRRGDAPACQCKQHHPGDDSSLHAALVSAE